MGAERALHELYRLQDELTAVARASGIEDLDIRVDEALRVVVIDARRTPVDVDDALGDLVDTRVEIRRARPADRPGSTGPRHVGGGAEPPRVSGPAERVRLHIGPLPSDLTREWITEQHARIGGARGRSEPPVNGDALELLEAYLDIWQRESRRSNVFDWTYDLHVDVFLLIASQWLALGADTAPQRADVGVPPAGDRGAVVTDAVLRGIIEALQSLGGRGKDLLDRIT